MKQRISYKLKDFYISQVEQNKYFAINRQGFVVIVFNNLEAAKSYINNLENTEALTKLSQQKFHTDEQCSMNNFNSIVEAAVSDWASQLELFENEGGCTP